MVPGPHGRQGRGRRPRRRGETQGLPATPTSKNGRHQEEKETGAQKVREREPRAGSGRHQLVRQPRTKSGAGGKRLARREPRPPSPSEGAQRCGGGSLRVAAVAASMRESEGGRRRTLWTHPTRSPPSNAAAGRATGGATDAGLHRSTVHSYKGSWRRNDGRAARCCWGPLVNGRHQALAACVLPLAPQDAAVLYCTPIEGDNARVGRPGRPVGTPALCARVFRG